MVRALHAVIILACLVSTLLAIGIWASPASAQDTPDEAIDTAAPPPAEGEEQREGVIRGAYWWAEVDPPAVAAFTDLGIEAAAFRLGELENIRRVRSSGEGEAALPIGWKTGGDFSALSGLPSSLSYRAVVETDAAFWHGVSADDLVSFASENIAAPLAETGVRFGSIELRLPDAVDPGKLQDFLSGAQDAGFPVNLEVGVSPSFLGALGRMRLESLAPLVGGMVIYFLDYDYQGLSPRIADRAWISETCVEVSSLGIPFTAVLPIYNRAVRYPAEEGASPQVLPAMDLAVLQKASEVRAMGSAGTEYTVIGPLDGLEPLKVGDRIRLLAGIEEIDIASLSEELPAMAPQCREIDLFRFPLVPGFDPDPGEVMVAAGLQARPADEVADPLAAAHKELDEKYNKGQQFILIFTIGFMVILLMRMFMRGAPAKGGGEGGSK